MKRVALKLPPIPGRPWLLDLYCGAGGTSMGYYQAGFNVMGVDIEPQPHYPFYFQQADALAWLRLVLRNWSHGRFFVALHASPPCQRYSHTQRIQEIDYPDLIGPTRALMQATGLPYVIENVEDARDELVDPIMLCGAMFPGLRTYRHRLFEASFPLQQPYHPAHTAPQNKMGRPPADGEFMHVVGNFSGVPAARQAMGISWMTRNELKEAIPPAYTLHVGEALMAHLDGPDRPLPASGALQVPQAA